MSKIKHPQQKKQLSYQKDCRNCYGENDKSSRKSIHRAKTRSSRLQRRSDTELSKLTCYQLDTELAQEVDATVRVRAKQARYRGFKKVPDEPLNRHLQRKLKH
ncbi:hypothetical protein [Celerinatantimonas sp. MCCC 1A17872]|uniref:hypothetical protein n=1 Tax=Celerinatantimonas sp. MCCC 1A17872 TaxID=3177514 RepID=UPI0038C6D96B